MSELSDPPILRVAIQDGVARLTLNRPETRNALSRDLMTALNAALDKAGADDAVRVVLIDAAGPAFCAGHDLRELSALTGDAVGALFAQCSALMLGITRLPKPVIASVQGMATAAGCQLVATCDLAIAADTARFATPGVNIGLFCSTPMVALTRAVGAKPAMEMLLTGEPLSAMRAAEIGLINRVVPASDLAEAAMSLARTIAARSALTLSIGKQAFYHQAGLPLGDAYDYASAVMTRNMATSDAAEGIDAFLTKRAPVWTGR